MKKLLVILLIIALLFAFPVSAAKNNDDTGSGGDTGVQASAAYNKTTATWNGNSSGTTPSSGNQGGLATAQENMNQSAGQGTGISENLTTLRNQKEIKAQIRLIEKESANFSGSETNNMLKNRNTVHAAVQALIVAGNLSGVTGEQISAIAQEFNNSLALQYSAEERIQDKNAVSRFFFGGDSDAAGEIRDQIEANQERIENLNTLMNDCDCDDELRTMIQAQIQVLEEEQNRLQELSQAELDDKGLLGGLFG